MRTTKKDVLIYHVLCIIGAIIIGTCLIVLAYCIPVTQIRNNARESISIYQNENDKWFWASELSYTRIDNFTDSLMINEASFLGTGSVIKDAMNNPHVNYEDIDSKRLSMVKEVRMNNLEEAIVSNYARYWHGYLIFLKPLLIFFNIQEIRILNLLLQSFFFCWCFAGLKISSALSM